MVKKNSEAVALVWRCVASRKAL